MRILDIDLDFFLNDKANSPVTSVDRLDDTEYIPWQQEEVQSFLENNCGLDRNRRIPGKFFIHHVEVFHYLRYLQEQNNFQLEFSIDHVDAHADLGHGDASFIYISTEILAMPLLQRAYPTKLDGYSGLSSGNYLAFAAACRWLSELNYISRPEWHPDAFWFHFQGFDNACNNLQLKQFSKSQISNILNGGGAMSDYARRATPIALEPLIPYQNVAYEGFTSNGQYDYIFLTQSPGFTPNTSDVLIPLIQSYMDLQ